jgi:hypothetical protein
MKIVLIVFILISIVFLMSCNVPEEEQSIDVGERRGLLHCIPIREYAVIGEDSAHKGQIVLYKVLQDTLTDEYVERFVRSFQPRRQVYIFGYVELSDFTKAGRGIYYLDPQNGPKLLQYEGARIVKRVVKGDSPWTIAAELENPNLMDRVQWGEISPNRDFIIDLDVLEAVSQWGELFDLPSENYRIIGKEVRKIVVKGSDEGEEGQKENETFMKQQAVLEQDSLGRHYLAFYNVFEDNLKKQQRKYLLYTLIPDNQVYILGYERIVPELSAKGRGIFYVDPDSGAMLLEYEYARIVKRVVKGDSQWKIATELGNISTAKKISGDILHPGETFFIDLEILEAVGWSKQSFDLPDNTYRILGYPVSEVILRE